jgi:hypothetical protein
VVASDWLTFGARYGSGWGPSVGPDGALTTASARTDATEKVQGCLLYSSVARRNSVEFLFSQAQDIFKDIFFRSLPVDSHSIFGYGKTERVSPNCDRLMKKKCHQIKTPLFLECAEIDF